MHMLRGKAVTVRCEGSKPFFSSLLSLLLSTLLLALFQRHVGTLKRSLVLGGRQGSRQGSLIEGSSTDSVMPSCEPIRRHGLVGGLSLVGEGGGRASRDSGSTDAIKNRRITTFCKEHLSPRHSSVAPNCGLGLLGQVLGRRHCVYCVGLGSIPDTWMTGQLSRWAARMVMFVCCLGAVAVSMLLCSA
ncbi:hypothetical protein B0T20DRAFT_133979 [Sordaria brevicollis]|uniref:Uncharacterized protein n=1 Tax=Sordaria brevicollis TaxID=83679 RepID=A0AAE0PLM9_SORBR|nr:hypothetical protein B0T20DRAFT_133979 [Sordaria brevicollis]